MTIQTERLQIVPFQEEMARALHLLSLDEDNRRFVPDEVFETEQEALQVIQQLRQCYQTGNGPQVYAVLQEEELVGYVQAVPVGNSWEIGYHIGKSHTGQGFAKEAVQAFLPVIMPKLDIREMLAICLLDNVASVHVLEHCGFQKQFEGMGNYQGKERSICRYLIKR